MPDYRTGCGCIAMILGLVIGAPLTLIAAQNIKIKNANPEIRKVALKDLVTSPPETALWVEVSGVPVEGSYVNELGYMLLRDPENKVAVYVFVGKAPLSSKNDETLVIRGMIDKTLMGVPVPKDPPRNNVSPDVEVAPLFLEKDSSPPGWFASWGLMMLGIAILAVPPAIMSSRRR